MRYEELKGLIEDGYSQRGIGEYLGVSQTTVRYWIAKYNIDQLSGKKKRGLQKEVRRKKNFCNFCGKDTFNPKFCSPDCSYNNRKYSTWRKIRDSDSGEGFHCLTVKGYLLHERGRVCEICSISEWIGQPVPLVMDHINGDSGDNLLSNLRLVCGNCDMQLPTYKSKNNGNGRHSRRERYENGQSY